MVGHYQRESIKGCPRLYRLSRSSPVKSGGLINLCLHLILIISSVHQEALQFVRNALLVLGIPEINVELYTKLVGIGTDGASANIANRV